MRPHAALATIAGLAVCQSLGATENSTPFRADTQKKDTKWEFSLSTFTFLSQHARDYANPNFTADRDWLQRGLLVDVGKAFDRCYECVNARGGGLDLRHELTHDASATRADRRTHRDLALA